MAPCMLTADLGVATILTASEPATGRASPRDHRYCQQRFGERAKVRHGVLFAAIVIVSAVSDITRLLYQETYCRRYQLCCGPAICTGCYRAGLHRSQIGAGWPG